MRLKIKYLLGILLLLFLFSSTLVGYEAPSGFTASTGDSITCIDLSWNAHWFEGYGYTDYEIRRDGSHLLYTDAYAHSHSDCGLTAGQEYCYRVRAWLYYNGSWYYSDWTSTSCAYPKSGAVPPTPHNFVVQTGDSAEVELIWADTSALTDYYEIYRGGNQIEADYTYTNYSDYPLNPGAEYCYYVKACNAAGCSDPTSTNCDTAGNPPADVEPEPGTMPCKYPPVLSETVPANVLIIYDNSGSMGEQAYYGNYNDGKNYYGYAERNKIYDYQSGIFEPIADWTTGDDIAKPGDGEFKGNFLNWLCMKRIDIARKVMVGGKCVDRSVAGPKVLWGAPNSRDADKDYEGDYDIYDGWFNDPYNNTYYIKIRGSTNPEGVVQNVSDRLRLGLMFFHNDQGGYIADYVGAVCSDMVTAIEDEEAQNWTPLAETFYEATRYFQATTGYFNSTNYAAHDPIINGCDKNFVIIITDGESTQDQDMPEHNNFDSYEPDTVPTYWPSNGSEDLRDITFWGHVTDLRPDDYPTWNNTIFTYCIYTFGQNEDDAVTLLNRAARNGGFDDQNGNNIPDLEAEWDYDGDGYANSFYMAEDGDKLEDALEYTFIDIMRRLDAASAVSVVTNSLKGEGTAFQAIYSPKRLVGEKTLQWIGNVQALWLDQLGNLREDTDNDGYLDMIDDYIVRIYFDGEHTMGERYDDSDGDGVYDVGDYHDELRIYDLNFVWNAGDNLLVKSAASRDIKAIIPQADSAIFLDFTTSNSDSLLPYLNAANDAEADSIIQYIRGIDYPTYRDRTISGNVWKLGDIVNSRPELVPQPRDRYDLIYNDMSYTQFYMDNLDRQPVIYIGGNDGSLKAFNAGKFVPTDDVEETGYLEDYGTSLGEELFSVIPFNLLPHLRWLTNPDYCHVYYVDLPIVAVDVRIFSDDSKHTQGWGTVLITGQNFGGTPCPEAGGDTLVSSYFAMDVTDPLDPELMWVYRGYPGYYTSTCPCVFTVDTLWGVIFGSGPTDLAGRSDQYAFIDVLDVKTGDNLFNHTFSEDNSSISDPLTVDVDMDYDCDIAYFALSNYDEVNAEWGGKIYRITFSESVDTADWSVSEFIDIGAPSQARGAVTMDYYGNIWYFMGTGRYMSDFDESSTQTQYFIGAKDPYWQTGSGSVALGDLYDITDVLIYDTDSGYIVENTVSGTQTYPEFLQELATYSGWYMRFEGGERIIAEPALFGETIFFTSYIPNADVCGFGGDGFLYGLDYLTGTPNPQVQSFGKRDSLSDTLLNEKISLGEGVPTSPTAHIGSRDKAKISVQLSTGEIKQVDAGISPQKSKTIFWKGR